MYSDRVEKVGGHILINAATEMPPWVVSSHRPTIVTFQSRKYVVEHVRPLESARLPCRLGPAEESEHNIPGRSFIYDQAFVDEREDAVFERQKAVPRDILLTLTSPLIGFLCCSNWLNARDAW